MISVHLDGHDGGGGDHDRDGVHDRDHGDDDDHDLPPRTFHWLAESTKWKNKNPLKLYNYKKTKTLP